MRLGLLGGTFDPIHYGHLFIAEEARLRCELDEVWLVPNNQPAHAQGKSAFATPENRFEMCEIAVEGNPYFSVSRIELDRPGKSYAFDTLTELQAQTDAELFFIMGGDSINEILTWYRGAELFDLCRFVAASRPGTSLENAKNLLNVTQASRVEWMEVPGLYIASRDLRERVSEAETIRYLLPEKVREYIETLSLYRQTAAQHA